VRKISQHGRSRSSCRFGGRADGHDRAHHGRADDEESRQTVVVENVTGAGGNIGVSRVVRATPDGYMISIGHIGPHVINGAMYRLEYDLLSDLAPVGMFVTNPQIIVSKNSLPSKDLKSLVEYARSTPISIATGGAGTPSHIGAVYFQKLTGGAAQIIHYRGGAPASADVMAGHVDMFFDQAVNALPQSRSGKVRAHAVTQTTRLSVAPDIPTVDEAGMPGYYMAVWHGLWVPRGTPPAVIARSTRRWSMPRLTTACASA